MKTVDGTTIRVKRKSYSLRRLWLSHRHLRTCLRTVSLLRRRLACLSHSELLHDRRHIQAKCFELLQQVEDDRRARLRDAAEPAASAIPFTLVDDHQLIDIAERRGNRAEDPCGCLQDRRHLLENRLQARRLVELFPGFRFSQDRRGFGDALRFDRLRLGQTDRFNFRRFCLAFGLDSRCAPDTFLAQLLLFRFGECDQG